MAVKSPSDSQSHSHSHAHIHGHSHSHGHGDIGHNHPPDQPHLHSHPHADPQGTGPGVLRDEDQLLADALMEGFVGAEDKASFLRMARIPLSLEGEKGEKLRLVDVETRYAYQVATASPGFNRQDLVYLPFPSKMIRERATMNFVYVSLHGRRDVDLAEMIRILEPDREAAPEL